MSSVNSNNKSFQFNLEITCNIDIKTSTTTTYDPASVMCSPPTSPVSPTASPYSSTYASRHAEEYRIENTLTSKGHIDLKKLSEALQGTIWETSKNGSSNIIKVTDKSLHDKHITYVDDTEITIQENIINESRILKYLTTNDPPPTLVQFIDFFYDTRNYFLVMQHGGHSFFEFVKKCHQYIEHELLDITQWLSFCVAAMQQTVGLLAWLHDTMHCCHLDVSLENFVISNVHVHMDRKTKKILRFNEDFHIKIIDFGLAEVFTTTDKSGLIDFSCTKYVGKTAYKSPEVHRKKGTFDARGADCWSLGISFFMMLIGAPPFKRASRKDPMFVLIMNGQILDILYAWNRVHYITAEILDLFQRIFVAEKDRMTIQEIQEHASLVP
eukprot:189395_1